MPKQPFRNSWSLFYSFIWAVMPCSCSHLRGHIELSLRQCQITNILWDCEFEWYLDVFSEKLDEREQNRNLKSTCCRVGIEHFHSIFVWVEFHISGITISLVVCIFVHSNGQLGMCVSLSLSVCKWNWTILDFIFCISHERNRLDNYTGVVIYCV